ncbi:type II secretion system protein [Halobaculum sp. MBLA0143]|uniref:type II secretion system protein n=1 Tax=Halobaculum sp. MBLA0143 TaxID=3079933 RepID=UPI0035266344
MIGRDGDAEDDGRGVVAVLAELWPGAPTAGERLRRAVRFRRSAPPAVAERTADRIVAAGYTVGVAATLLAAVVAYAAGAPGAVSVAAPPAVGLCVTHAVHRTPVWRAEFRRSRAVGATATVVGLIAVRLRLDAPPERAAAFAADTASGPLAASLARHVAAARATPTTGLDDWAADWRTWFPALDRSVALLVAAADAPQPARDRTLDRAVSAVGDAVERRAGTFATEIRGPVTALYAGGVLLPLALVGAVPAATVTGLPVGATVFVAVYDLLLPAAVCLAGARVLLARPVAFPPPRLPRDHPALPDDSRRTVAAVAAGVTGGWIAASVAVADWAAPLSAVGFGLGPGLLVRFRPARRLRRRVTALERGLPDALALVGRRVADGVAVETAVRTAGDRLPPPVGEAFTVAARRRRTLGVGVRRAFCGDDGPFAETPTVGGRAAATLLSVAAEAGPPAGELLVTEAERLETLRDHERRARRSVAAVTDTLENTAAVFGPLVGGTTVALAGGLDGLSAATDGGAALETTVVGGAVGGYVLALAVLLPTLAVGLREGVDRALVGYRVGRSLTAATATFLLAVRATGLLV